MHKMMREALVCTDGTLYRKSTVVTAVVPPQCTLRPMPPGVGVILDGLYWPPGARFVVGWYPPIFGHFAIALMCSLCNCLDVLGSRMAVFCFCPGVLKRREARRVSPKAGQRLDPAFEL